MKTLSILCCVALATPAVAATFTVGGYTWDSDNAVTTAAFSEGGPGFFAATPFPEGTRSIGKLMGDPAAGAVFVDITNTITNSARSTVTMSWAGAVNGASLSNLAGMDFAIYETGSAGAPEAYAVSVRNAVSGVFSSWFFFQADAFDAGASAFATGFDISDFGAGISAIDAIAVRSVFNSAGPNGGDRVDIAGGGPEGMVSFDVGAGNFLANVLTAGPQGPAGEFAASRLDADIVYAVGLHNTVPEPDAVVLGGLAAAVVGCRRRLRNSSR